MAFYGRRGQWPWPRIANFARQSSHPEILLARCRAKTRSSPRQLSDHVGMDDPETVRDIEKARQTFGTTVTEPDPNAARRMQRKVGTVTARKRDSKVVAGSLSFGVEDDGEGSIVVRTTQFTTEPDFEGQHVALLLAYDLREHYGVDALRSSPMKPTEGGAGVLASLRRRGIMTPLETEG